MKMRESEEYSIRKREGRMVFEKEGEKKRETKKGTKKEQIGRAHV